MWLTLTNIMDHQLDELSCLGEKSSTLLHPERKCFTKWRPKFGKTRNKKNKNDVNATGQRYWFWNWKNPELLHERRNAIGGVQGESTRFVWFEESNRLM